MGIRNARWPIYAAAICLAASAGAQEIPYQSDEFRRGDSPIPTIFGCMFAAHQTGAAPDAQELAIDFMLNNGITPEQVDTWAHDATIYISQEIPNTDWHRYWDSNCEEQFRRMRKLAEKG